MSGGLDSALEQSASVPDSFLQTLGRPQREDSVVVGVCVCVCVCVHAVTQLCLTLVTVWTAHEVPLSMGFSRQEHWSGLPFLLQGIFPTQGFNPHALQWQATLYPCATWGAHCWGGGVTTGTLGLVLVTVGFIHLDTINIWSQIQFFFFLLLSFVF